MMMQVELNLYQRQGKLITIGNSALFGISAFDSKLYLIYDEVSLAFSRIICGMDLDTLRKKYRSHILASARQYHLEDVRIFGSTARGEATEHSDVDFMVVLGEGSDLMQLGAFYMDMQNLLKCKVDIVTPDSIHHYIRDAVLQEATPL